MYIERIDDMRGLFPVPPVLSGRVLCLRPLTSADTEDLRRLTRQEIVYRYLPTFLFEKKSLFPPACFEKNGFILVNHAVDEDWGMRSRRPRTSGSGKGCLR